VREFKSIRSVSRLLLTGTPIQNTLEELWSLLNFCCPAVFDDLQVFQSWFGFRNIGHDTQVDDIIGKEQQERIVYKLHEILRPFLLRRMKKDVLLNMPPKKEIVVYCPMSNLQKAFYSRVLDGTIRDTLVSMNIENGKDVSLQNMQMNLRKVCNHPFLFGEPRDDDGIYLGSKDPRVLITASGKFRLLERMLPVLKQGGHKVLIFSQMTELLNILEDYITVKGYQYCRLDGSTKVVDRQKGIDKFNKDPNVFLFLLSTRAGGLGINLTAADTCILFDSDFNPHQDSQGNMSHLLVYIFIYLCIY
jgi:ATP-dependent DNA helicase